MTGQTIQKTAETAVFTEYLLENDSLKIDHSFDFLVPDNAGNRFEIISQQVIQVNRPGITISEIEAFALAPDEQPFFELMNPGVHRGNQVMTLRVHVARFNASNPENLLIARSARFRIYKQQNSRPAISALQTQLLNESSPFATGDWYKIPVQKNGIYSLNRDYLVELGVPVDQIDPRNIQIWTTPGGELPRRNSDPRPILQEIPIVVNGESNGNFDVNDTILFYGSSPHEVFRTSSGIYSHQLHRYSDNNYVFLTIGSQPGKRMQQTTASNPQRTITQFRDFTWKEEDRFKSESKIRSGNEWYSQRLTTNPAELQQVIFNDTIPGIIPNQQIEFDINVIGRSIQTMGFSFFVNGQSIGTTSVPAIQSYVSEEGISGRARRFQTNIQTGNLSNNVLEAVARISFSDPNTEGFIDWVRFTYQRAFVAKDDYLFIFAPADGSAQETGQYILQNFSRQPLVFEVSDPQNPVLLQVNQSGNNFAFTYSTNPELRFIAQAEFIVPEPGEQIVNQDLRGISVFPQYIIITNEVFRDLAQEWAAYRSQRDGFSTVVALQSQIFNEFGGGVPDVTAIRDYVKYLYDRALNAGQPMPEHLLLFGTATFDYKGVQPNAPIPNHVFTFQSDESLHRINSFGSDDYFGLLDDNEGEWLPITSSERIDIGIGRFSVQSVSEARLFMDKIRNYESSETAGSWRTNFTFAADDDFPEVERNRDLHLLNADGTAIQIDKVSDALQINKIYMLSFPVENTATGRRIPAATDEFIRSINDGTLVINYSGHGNEDVLADERLFTKDDINKLNNRDRLSIFVTATCQFGRYDDNGAQSGAELALTHPNGGMVAAFTTTRVVFTSSTAGSNNFGLNIQLTRQMVERDSEGRPQRLGDIYRRTKNTSQGSGFNARKFILLGDPAMRIGLPENEIEITELNNVDFTINPDTVVQIRALDEVLLNGRVKNRAGDLQGNFNGEAEIIVYDVERTIELPDKQWVIEGRCFLDDCNYNVENDILFRGRTTVNNGIFTSNFIIPRDISFSPETGRIMIYASGSGGDASGSIGNINFNGINPDARDDGTGPEMDVYLNDKSFVNGNLVGNTSTLVVELFDESGINTTGLGVGHEITATIDTQPRQTFVLNDFFRSNLDDFRSGRIEYPMQELPEGSYNLTVRAWDVHNNPSEKTIFFEVADSDQLEIRSLANYPNPMNNFTRFIFEHNQPGNLLDIDIRIFTLSGRPVARLQESQITTNSYANIEWNGRDGDYDRLANGTYIYVLRVRADTPQGRQTREEIEKLVIIR
ncbi:MAG: type IX secretion system sortase PorU [Balneolaceae bacterium]